MSGGLRLAFHSYRLFKRSDAGTHCNSCAIKHTYRDAHPDSHAYPDCHVYPNPNCHAYAGITWHAFRIRIPNGRGQPGPGG